MKWTVKAQVVQTTNKHYAVRQTRRKVFEREERINMQHMNIQNDRIVKKDNVLTYWELPEVIRDSFPFRFEEEHNKDRKHLDCSEQSTEN